MQKKDIIILVVGVILAITLSGYFLIRNTKKSETPTAEESGGTSAFLESAGNTAADSSDKSEEAAEDWSVSEDVPYTEEDIANTDGYNGENIEEKSDVANILMGIRQAANNRVMFEYDDFMVFLNDCLTECGEAPLAEPLADFGFNRVPLAEQEILPGDVIAYLDENDAITDYAVYVGSNKVVHLTDGVVTREWITVSGTIFNGYRVIDEALDESEIEEWIDQEGIAHPHIQYADEETIAEMGHDIEGFELCVGNYLSEYGPEMRTAEIEIIDVDSETFVDVCDFTVKIPTLDNPIIVSYKPSTGIFAVMD